MNSRTWPLVRTMSAVTAPAKSVSVTLSGRGSESFNATRPRPGLRASTSAHSGSLAPSARLRSSTVASIGSSRWKTVLTDSRLGSSSQVTHTLGLVRDTRSRTSCPRAGSPSRRQRPGTESHSSVVRAPMRPCRGTGPATRARSSSLSSVAVAGVPPGLLKPGRRFRMACCRAWSRSASEPCDGGGAHQICVPRGRSPRRSSTLARTSPPRAPAGKRRRREPTGAWTRTSRSRLPGCRAAGPARSSRFSSARPKDSR
mmetsp:Transcript_111377/g.355388  ORF Transcript_111377/g.355388 Transcript_111377/m.355388 type:complete len:257 (-) Transcript_111377:1272-2042(-)